MAVCCQPYSLGMGAVQCLFVHMRGLFSTHRSSAASSMCMDTEPDCDCERRTKPKIGIRTVFPRSYSISFTHRHKPAVVVVEARQLHFRHYKQCMDQKKTAGGRFVGDGLFFICDTG